MDDAEPSIVFLQCRIDDLLLLLEEREQNEGILRTRLKQCDDERRNAVEAVGRLRNELASCQLQNDNTLEVLQDERLKSVEFSKHSTCLESNVKELEREKSILLPRMSQLQRKNEAICYSSSQMYDLLRRMACLLTEHLSEKGCLASTAHELNDLLNEWRRDSASKDNITVSVRKNYIELQGVIDCVSAEMVSCRNDLEASLWDDRRQREAVTLLAASVDTLQNETNSKQKLMEELQRYVDISKSELVCKEDELQQLQNVHNELRDKLEDAAKEAVETSNSEIEMASLLSEKDKQLTDVRVECQSLKENLHFAQSIAEEAKREVDLANDEIQKLRLQLFESDASVQCLERDLAKIRNGARLITEEEDVLATRWQQLKAEQASACRDYEEFKRQYADNETQLKIATDKCRGYEDELRDTRSQLEHWKSVGNEEVTKSKVRQEQVGDSKASLEASRVDLWDEKRQNGELQLKLEHAAAELNETRHSVIQLRASLAQSQEETKSLSRTCAEYSTTMEVLRVEVKRLEESKAIILENTETKSKEIELLLSSKDDELTQQRRRCEEWQTQSRDQSRLIEDLKRQHEAHSTKMDRLTAVHEKETVEMRSKVDALSQSLDAEVERHRSTQDALEMCRNDLSSASTGIAELKGRVSNFDAEMRQKRNEMDILKTANRELENCVEQYRAEMCASEEQWESTTSEILESFFKTTS